jgi:purine-binding chemotaxis protein CheW
VDEKYLIFTVRDKRYALPSKIISEVAALEKAFPLPLVPNYVRGLINRYSVPYALIDISFLLHKDSLNTRNLKTEKVIVLKEEVDKLAFLIDDVTDIADLPSEQLMKIEQEENSVAGMVSAFFEWKDDSVFCLDTGEIISRIKQDFGQQEA